MSTGKSHTNKSKEAVFCIFDTRLGVEDAVSALQTAGFRESDISVLLPKMGDTERFAHEKNTKAPEGTTVGATTGAVIGGGLGWLASLGMLTIPGVGPLMAAGPIVATLAGIGVGGAAGGLTGALIGFGIPEFEAKRYESIIKDGGILLSVHVDNSDWKEKAETILESMSARDISCVKEVAAAERDRVSSTKDINITPIF